MTRAKIRIRLNHPGADYHGAVVLADRVKHDFLRDGKPDRCWRFAHPVGGYKMLVLETMAEALAPS